MDIYVLIKAIKTHILILPPTLVRIEFRTTLRRSESCSSNFRSSRTAQQKNEISSQLLRNWDRIRSKVVFVSVRSKNLSPWVTLRQTAIKSFAQQSKEGKRPEARAGAVMSLFGAGGQPDKKSSFRPPSQEMLSLLLMLNELPEQ